MNVFSHDGIYEKGRYPQTSGARCRTGGCWTPPSLLPHGPEYLRLFQPFSQSLERNLDTSLTDFHSIQHLKQHPFPEDIPYGDVQWIKSAWGGEEVRIVQVLGTPGPDVIKSELHFTTRDGHRNRALVYRPATPPRAGSPVIAYFHGGGYCAGAPEGEEHSCRNFVNAFGAVAVSLGYRLAPENPWPAAINDAWDGLRWVAMNARSWGGEPSVGFVVGGNSAGGHIAALLAHLARDENLSPPLTGTQLLIPYTICRGRVPEKYRQFYLSREQNKDAICVNETLLSAVLAAYNMPDDDDVTHNVISHPNGHAGLPPTALHFCGGDPLRDDALIYERALREVGVETRSIVYPGVPHSHWTNFPKLKASQKFRQDQIETMSWLLGGRKPDFSKVIFIGP